MSIAVETLGKLERRMTLTLPLANVKAEVEKQLKIRARTAKAPGFRPGKVPMKMVAAQYGYEIENDVLNTQIGEAFEEAANANNLRIAGLPKIEPKKAEGSETGEAETIAFDATFEIYPEVAIGDLSKLEVEKITSEVTDAEIDKTIEILRKQMGHFHVKGEAGEHGDGGPDQTAQNGDRATIDFVGTIDGVEFAGGKAEDYQFVLGEGRMLPEFETAIIGLKVGQSKTFPLTFPADYHGKDVAGKTAEFTITLKKLEWMHLPEINAEFASFFGVADGDLQKMREEVKKNLERTVNDRANAKTKESVLNALLDSIELEVPTILVERDKDTLLEKAREDFVAQYGPKMRDLPLERELFTKQAERRVRLGLIVTEIAKAQNIEASEEQMKTRLFEIAQSYQDPQQFIKHTLKDRQALAHLEAYVLENNVVDYILSQAKATTKAIPFDELMNSAQAAQ